MDLEGNYILGVGATYLAKVLKDNVYVTELVSMIPVSILCKFISDHYRELSGILSVR